MPMKTKVTEKNMMNVMGKINTFFKKDVKEDKGIVNKIVGFKNELTISGIQYDRPIYHRERLFTSYTGFCKIHHMRKEILEKKKEGKPSPFHKTDALLAICTPQSPDCIPICIGDTVEIVGTKMMVKTNTLGRYHTRTFLQMPVSVNEKADEIKIAVLNNLLWFCDDSIWNDIFEDDILTAIHINSEISHSLSNFVSQIDFANETGIKSLEIATANFDCYVPNDDVKFKFNVNIDAILKGDMDNAMYIELGSEIYKDTYCVVSAAMYTAEDFVTEEEDI
jgi:hypothetical protein